MLKASCLKLEIKEIKCYEAKIGESEKGRQPPGVEPRISGGSSQVAASYPGFDSRWLPAFSPSYGNRTATSPHNPVYVLPAFFTFLYFRLITSKFLSFQLEARCSRVRKTMGENLPATPNGVLTAHSEWLPGVRLRRN